MCRKLLMLFLALFLAACQGSPLIHFGPTPTPFPEKFEGSAQVGEFTLKMFCDGTGEPTIILENGLDAVSWYYVKNSRFSKITRTCTYVRAGMADTVEITSPRTTQDQVADLHSLLQQTGVPGPYVLVGHSIAGFNMTLYTQTYPKEVVGLVCVDCRPPQFGQMIADNLGPVSPNDSYAIRQIRDNERWLAVDGMQIQEHLDILSSGEQVEKVTSLGDRPFVVLVTSQPATFGDDKTDQMFIDTWQEANKFYVNLSSRSRMEVVPNTDHGSILKNEAVDKAVKEVYDAVTGK